MPNERKRLPGAHVRASVQRDLVSPPTTAASFREAAEAHALEALEALAWLAQNAKSEAARVSAANAVLDRALGRPASGARAAAEHAADEEAEVGPMVVRWLDAEKS